MTSATLRDIERQLHADAVRLAPEFAAFRGLKAELDEAARARPGLLVLHLRQALEAGALTRKGVAPALARAAAARAAAQFITAEADALNAEDRAALPAWVPAMAAEVSPGLGFLARSFGLSGAEAELLHHNWPHLGTAEALMETGGDIRLARDPQSALNGYGCSHRPRPWAITFASSTASSSSERGYVAADRMRLRITAVLLRGMEPRQVIRQSIEAVRRGIASAFGLGADERIILAASGTDTELLALALTHLAGTDKPILNILIAPEETGRGVPMAARGLHFAVDTARGHDVTFEAPIDGFRPDTALANVLLRETSGTVRPEAVVEAEIEAVLAAGIAEGKRVILHGLDLSKTGLLAPSPAFLAKLRRDYGDGFDFVLDACQTRLSPASLRAYLALDAVVLITGSKFFTGPPFRRCRHPARQLRRPPAHRHAARRALRLFRARRIPRRRARRQGAAAGRQLRPVPALACSPGRDQGAAARAPGPPRGNPARLRRDGARSHCRAARTHTAGSPGDQPHRRR